MNKKSETKKDEMLKIYRNQLMEYFKGREIFLKKMIGRTYDDEFLTKMEI